MAGRPLHYSTTSRLHYLGILLVLASVLSVSPASAALDIETLYQMALHDEGQSAVETVADEAWELGRFGPAPGDLLYFDRFMCDDVRGAVTDADEMPCVCEGTPMCEEVAEEIVWHERLVRFSILMFWDDERQTVRSADDVLATFIEETGHSWQEYIYETEGRGWGQRLRRTTTAESVRWGPGREYQVKMYILSLDGDLLKLSKAQRDLLGRHLCGGYADPLGAEVPGYGPPPGWPNPEGWPTSAPRPEDHAVFCASV